MQINHSEVIKAKNEGVRKMLPEICRKAAESTGSEIDHVKVQKFVAKRE